MKIAVKHLRIPVIHFKYLVKVIVVSIYARSPYIPIRFFFKIDITGGPVLDEYQFLQFHMHWGLNENEGSEHVIDGVRLPAEVRENIFIFNEHFMCIVTYCNMEYKSI